MSTNEPSGNSGQLPLRLTAQDAAVIVAGLQYTALRGNTIEEANRALDLLARIGPGGVNLLTPEPQRIVLRLNDCTLHGEFRAKELVKIATDIDYGKGAAPGELTPEAWAASGSCSPPDYGMPPVEGAG